MKKFKKLLSIMLALIMVVSAVPVTAFGADGGTVACTESGCSGTYVNGFCTVNDSHCQAAVKNADGYYEIGNAGQLYWFKVRTCHIAESRGNCAKLTDDIVVNPGTFDENGNYIPKNGETVREWEPIGSSYNYSYTGTFDGNGKTISGLYYNSGEDAYVGLFGYVNGGATIKDIGVINSCFYSSFSSKSVYIGALAGFLRCSDGDIISNCYVEGSQIGNTDNSSGGSNGGLFGEIAATDAEITISGCYSAANSLKGKSAYFDDVGGLVGFVNGSSGNKLIVKQCYNTSTIEVSGRGNAGGLIGAAESDAYILEISDCYSTGRVTGGGLSYVGAVLGYNPDDVSITTTNCYYLTGTADTDFGFSAVSSNTTEKTEDEFASGAVAWLLNGEKADGIWKQNLTGDKKMSAPGFTGGPVHYDAESGTYYNIHSFEDGVCAVCGYKCPHEAYSNGACAVCDNECSHVWGADGVCTACGWNKKVSQNGDGYYEISNSAQLNMFAEKVNSGETALKARLMANVNVSSKSDFTIGTKDNPFGGVFDGNGYTLKVNISSTAEAAAPFSYAGGASFKNLTVAGKVKTSAKYAGGFVGSTTGSLTFENCLSFVTIESTVDGDGTHGGFIGVANSGDGVNMVMKNCGFAGAINGVKTNSCGGFAGWLNATTTVENSFVAATFKASSENGNTVARNPSNLKLKNFYYLNAYGDIPSDAVAKTKQQFASGEVAFLLNKKSADGVWKQSLGLSGDSFPSFSGGTVYANYIDCSGAASEYGNEYFNEIPAHSFNDKGFCTVCNAHQPGVLVNGFYEIANAGQLMWFVDQKNVNNKSVNARLIDDIDLSGIDYTPVNAPYFATFDGNGHIISNMTINTKKVYYSGNMVYGYLGLFGGLGSNGVVKNLTLTGNITCTEAMARVGGVAGYVTGTNAEISNVNSCVNITSGSATGKELQYVGGIVGRVVSNGTHSINNCRYYGSISLDSGKYVGGIAGMVYGADSEFKSCENHGTVYVNNGNNIAGVAGYVYQSTVIENCKNHDSVTVNSGKYVGGVVGYLYGAAVIESCVNNGSVTVNSGKYVGGVVGDLTDTDSKAFKSVNQGIVKVNNGSYVGGVVGSMWSYAVVESCLNTGSVTMYGYDRVGGVVGSANQGSVIKNCGNTGAVKGISSDSNNPAPYVGGVLGFVWRDDFGGMTGCYNTGTVSAESGTKYCGALIGWGRNGPTADNTNNNYYLEGTKAFGTTSGSPVATSATKEQFTSGEIAYTLNGGVTNGTQLWYQELTDSMYSGSYPYITGKTVYKYTDCKGNVNYANKALSSGTHRYRADGLCAVCGAACTHTYNANGVCTVCGYEELKLVNGYYEISNAEQLYRFAAKVNSGENTIKGKLTADIVVNPGTFDSEGNYISKYGEAVRAWTPIGNDGYKYNGTFKGNGKTVSGLYFNDSTVNNVGLFGWITDADISGVGVINSYIHGGVCVGGIVGCGFYSLTKIYNCYNTGTVSGRSYVGGIVGSINIDAALDCCYNTGDVSAKENNVGGIAGELSSGGTRITNCYNTGKVRSGKWDHVGAVIGFVRDSDTWYSNCYYLAGCATDADGVVQNGIGGGIDIVGVDVVGKTTPKSAAAFASGEVCYLLNNSSSTGVWRQTLGIEKLPSFKGDKVNYNADSGSYHRVHSYVKGTCTECGARHDNHISSNGICTVCGVYEVPALNGDGYYEIANAGQLYWFAEKVNGGEATAKAKLIANIDASSKSDLTVGTKDNPFGGVFDGNGYTLTVNISSTAEAAAPFSYAGGASFKNLTVAGNVKTSAKYAGGFVGSTTGSLTFENCLSLVTIESSVDGDGTHGGFIGVVNSGDGVKMVMKNCGFAGAINGVKTNSCGGFAGWLNAPLLVMDSFVAATYRVSDENGNSIARNDVNLTLKNVYYLNKLGGNPAGIIAKTKQQFASGEVAFLLNNKSTDGVWKQNLGKNGDSFPSFKGGTVYANFSDCFGSATEYGNEFFKDRPEHPSYNGNGFCIVCGAYQPATLNSAGCYEIANAGQLLWFGEKVNSGERSACGKLTANIDLSGVNYTPITAPYRGTFDGNNYTISNMTVKTQKVILNDEGVYGYLGLFGGLGAGAVVKNLTLRGDITCTEKMKYVGGLAGYTSAASEISNVKSYVNIKDGGVKGKEVDRVGGIVGFAATASNASTVIKNCSYYGEINLDKASSAGGVIGYVGNSYKLLNCVNNGNVYVNGGSHVGGIVGSLYSSTVEGCVNYGSVEMRTHDCVGGVIGYASGSALIKACANIGSVSGTSTASNDQEPYVSGILGYINDSRFGGIVNCYNYGTLTASPGYRNCGAIVGWGRNGATAAKITNNYYLEGENVKAVGQTNDENVTATSATAARFASGEIAFLLNGGVTDGTQSWYQELTNTNKLDKYPVLSGKTVYKYTDCKGDENYANTALSNGSHNCDENGFCLVCDGYQEPVLNSDGYYEIGNAGQLYWFAQKVNSGTKNMNGKLTADIVVNPGTFSLEDGTYTPKNGEAPRQWVPIGITEALNYSGSFDGNGKTISGLYYNGSEYATVGLFGYSYGGATFKNLGVVNSAFFSSLSVRSYIGGLAGDVESKNGSITINGCYSSVYMYAQTETNIINSGGLVGYVQAYKGNKFTISGCYSTSTVVGTIDKTANIMAGGLVGFADSVFDSKLEIFNSYNIGNITGNTGGGRTRVGGIVGYVAASGSITIKNCYNTGSVSGSGGKSYVGGLLGENTGSLEAVENCYYLTGIASTGVGSGTGTTTAKTADEFASGEVAYLLQKGVSAVTTTDEEGNEVTTTPLAWGQKSSTDGSAPILTSNEAYRVLPVIDGEAVINYSVLKKGETNSDGVVDIYDYQNAVNVALSDNNFKTFSDNYDLNGDGILDVLDTAIAEQSDMSEAELAAFGEVVTSTEGMCYIKNADLDGDGVVDVLDISLLEKLMAGHRVEISLD